MAMVGNSKYPKLVRKPNLYGVGGGFPVASGAVQGHSLSDLYYFFIIAFVTLAMNLR